MLAFSYLDWSITLFAIYVYLPTTCLRRMTLEDSGMFEDTFPLTFALLYTYHAHGVLLVGSAIFVWSVLNLQRRTLKYQLKKLGFCLLSSFYFGLVGPAMGFIGIYAGRWWYVFGPITMCFNDSGAYFAGRLFGSHKLIGLSPNKTLEGYAGGLLSNIVYTLFYAGYLLDGGSFWCCAPKRFNYLVFEEYECPEKNAIYEMTTYKLPFHFMGYSEF